MEFRNLEYKLIEDPVPAGFSFSSKDRFWTLAQIMFGISSIFDVRFTPESGS